MDSTEPIRMLDHIDYPRPFFKCCMYKYIEVCQYCFYYRREAQQLYSDLHDVFKYHPVQQEWYHWEQKDGATGNSQKQFETQIDEMLVHLWILFAISLLFLLW